MIGDNNALRDAEFPRRALSKEGVTIRPAGAAPLSPAQVEFNRLMKSLENARSKHTREQSRLDKALEVSIQELMPLVADVNRVERDMVFAGRQILLTMKLTPKRRRWFGDLISGKASSLLADPVGLNAKEIATLESVVEELGPSKAERQMKEDKVEDFGFLRAMMEQVARNAGVDLDLSDIDLKGDPEEVARLLEERMSGIDGAMGGANRARAPRPRKPTKAQLEKERAHTEREEAKKRDFKSLFKQLAKALHPDLETDPVMKEHKDAWMKRLNTAYQNGDLRDMLQLEMEWLGEEATNLATAGEEKLRVYCMVLKEQLADLKRQTDLLPAEPQYGPLSRFIDPFTGFMENPRWIRKQLTERLCQYREMLEILEKDTHERREMIHQWADTNARNARRNENVDDCPF